MTPRSRSKARSRRNVNSVKNCNNSVGLLDGPIKFILGGNMTTPKSGHKMVKIQGGPKK